MASEHVREFDQSNFKSEVLESDVPVVVDFWAEWCRPCKVLGPTIDDLAADYAGRAKVGKVDTESNREISMEYNISAIPTVLIFKGGEVRKKFVGLTDKKDFVAALDPLLS